MKLKGLNEMQTKMSRMVNNTAPSSYRTAVIKALLRVEAESARRVPVDKHKLRPSGLGNARILKSGPEGASGIMGYTANYAVYVHERTELKHKPGKEAKFLQNAIAHELPQMMHNMKVDISGTMFPGGKS